jgi:hypothetical protein
VAFHRFRFGHDEFDRGLVQRLMDVVSVSGALATVDVQDFALRIM